MRIFISYSSKIRPIVKRLALDIEHAGHDPWFDQELTGGQNWWTEILNQIRLCDAFIIALAPETLASKPCADELRYALALNKPVLPVQLGDIQVEKLPTALRLIHVVDYRNRDTTAALKLSRAISQLPDALPLPSPLPTEPLTPLVLPPLPLIETLPARSHFEPTVRRSTPEIGMSILLGFLLILAVALLISSVLTVLIQP